MHPPFSNAEIEIFVAQAQQGNDAAFEKLFDHYYDSILRYVGLRIKSEEVEDLVGDIFLKIIKNLPRYKPQKHITDSGKGAFAAWIFRIARNQIIDHYRTNKEAQRLYDEETGDLLFDIPSPHLNPHESAEQHEAHRTIHKAIKKLPSTHREILELKFLHDFSNAEIAKITGKNEGTIRVAQLRALREIRKYFPEDD